MKKVWLLPILACLILFSCKKEGCIDSAATNYDAEAKKDDGSCIYPEPDPREDYLGSYWVEDSSWVSGGFYDVKNYALQITTGGTVSDTIYLNNLSNSGNNFIAIMAGSNFSIPSQHVVGPYYLTGSGNFTNNVITYETSGDAYINKGSGPKQ